MPTYDVPTVSVYDEDKYPKPLPRGWWHLLPPHIFFTDRASEGVYNVQEGKRQILALA